jgi:hypothetical protein
MAIKVYVLQSLRNADPKTGEDIRDFLDAEGIIREFYNIDSEEAFKEALNEIAEDISSSIATPYIHFDCHANDDGIGIVHDNGDESFLPWREIRKHFRKTYVNSKKRTVLCMSCCEGFHVSRLVAHNEPCPFDHVCGSFEKIGFTDSFNVFSELYKLVNGGKSTYEASVNVSNRPEFAHVKFIGLNAYTLFKIAVDGYIKNHLTPQKLAEIKAIAINAVLKKFGEVNQLRMMEIDFLCSVEGQKVLLEDHANTFFS